MFAQRTLFRGAIDELHSHQRGQGDLISLVAANLWARLPGPWGIGPRGQRPGGYRNRANAWCAYVMWL